MSETATRYRITAKQYQQMGEAGIIPPDARVELIEGEILEMSAIGSSHAAAVARLNRLFSGLHPRDRCHVWVQGSFRLDPASEPEPDIALVRYRADFYEQALPGPGDVLLLVEVADSSLPFDRARKLPLYAKRGIPECWILNLVEAQLEVHRDPVDGAWKEELVLRRGDRIAPTAFPDFEVAVSDLLP